MQGYLGTLEQGNKPSPQGSETHDTLEAQLRDQLLLITTGAGPGVNTGPSGRRSHPWNKALWPWAGVKAVELTGGACVPLPNSGGGETCGEGKGSPTQTHGGGSNLLINRKELTAAAPRRD